MDNNKNKLELSSKLKISINTVIHCDNKEDAVAVLLLASKLDIGTWSSGAGYAEYSFWNDYGSHTCYNFFDGCYQRDDYYIKRNFYIMPAQEFIDKHKYIIDNNESNCPSLPDTSDNVTYYIKGDLNRGKEVIDALISYGGITNEGELSGTCTNGIYTISYNNKIEFIPCTRYVYAGDNMSYDSENTGEIVDNREYRLIIKHGTELHLPEIIDTINNSDSVHINDGTNDTHEHTIDINDIDIEVIAKYIKDNVNIEFDSYTSMLNLILITPDGSKRFIKQRALQIAYNIL